MLDWDTCKKAFYIDGSLRDIYVQDTSGYDWVRFLELSSSLETTSFVNGKPAKLPQTVAEIFQKRDDAALLLTISLGDVKLNCHFFLQEEIELDFSPEQVGSQHELDALIGFLATLGRLLGKNVSLTDENLPDSRWFLYETSVDKVNFIDR